MKVAVLKEIVAGAKRTAAVPATVEKMVAAGIEVKIQAGAGLSSGFSDGYYRAASAAISPDADGVDVVLKVQRPVEQELEGIPERAALIAYTLQSRGDAGYVEKLKRRHISALSLDLLPRIARAQNMDVLSSMANIAGYKSVLLAANALGKFFPMLMTAAGTVLPARVFVLGAAAAGRQLRADRGRERDRPSGRDHHRTDQHSQRDGLPGISALLAQRPQFPHAPLRQEGGKDVARSRRRDRQVLSHRARRGGTAAGVGGIP